MHEAIRETHPITYHLEMYQPLRRPVLHLGGDLDGQARFSKLSVPAVDSAVAAYKFGSRCGAVRPHQSHHGDSHVILGSLDSFCCERISTQERNFAEDSCHPMPHRLV